MDAIERRPVGSSEWAFLIDAFDAGSVAATEHCSCRADSRRCAAPRKMRWLQ